jgi:hypothetical protein
VTQNSLRCFAHDPLTAEVQQYASWSLALNTKRTYQAGEKHYIDFCLMNRLYNTAGEIHNTCSCTAEVVTPGLAHRPLGMFPPIKRHKYVLSCKLLHARKA